VSDDGRAAGEAASWITGFSTAAGGKPRRIVDDYATEPDRGPEIAQSSTDSGGEPVDDAVEEQWPPSSQGYAAQPLRDQETSSVEYRPDRSLDHPTDGESDLVRAALAGARRIGRRRGRGSGSKRNAAGEPRRGGYSAPGPDPARDPQPVGALFAGYVEERGWEQPLAEARVFAEWPALVGRDVAAHCAPSALNAGELRISAESTAWATQLRLLSSTLLARLVAELGPSVVTKLIITGPVGPSWKHGSRSVRGARGPRDTYG
jgi:predicted nucleic acid-binding Zn ribbon protein